MHCRGYALVVLMALGLVSVAGYAANALTATPEKPIRVVVITGGHSFDEKAFPPLFEGYAGLEVTIAAQKDDGEIFDAVEGWDYDVIVLYTMAARMTEPRRANLMKLMDKGVGVVALHHTYAAYPDWPEFRKIIGVKYLQNAEEYEGKAYPKSSYLHDVDFTIHVADTDSPITQGITDFVVHDETYKDDVFEPDNHVLLTSDHATSDGPVAWTRQYRKAKVCTIQMGHGPQIFADENYRRLVAQAIRYCAPKEE